uniref:Uncharacterized protein n=1 Tax=Trichuris muris TaxID=70415 RepID=A0A5S6QLD1_TRIMR
MRESNAACFDNWLPGPEEEKACVLAPLQLCSSCKSRLNGVASLFARHNQCMAKRDVRPSTVGRGASASWKKCQDPRAKGVNEKRSLKEEKKKVLTVPFGGDDAQQ